MRKTTKIYLLTSVFALALLGCSILYRNAFAANYDSIFNSCVSSSSTPNMTEDLCRTCAYNATHNTSFTNATWSYSWIGPTDNVDSKVITVTDGVDIVPAVLRARRYSCDILSLTYISNYIYYAWIGESGNDTDPDSRVNWISPNQWGQINIGGHSGRFNWSRGADTPIAIDVAKFRRYVEAGNAGTDVYYYDGGVTYTADVSVNHCSQNIGLSKYVYGEHYATVGDVNYHFMCNGGNSIITIDIQDPVEKEAGNGEFVSRSTVTAPAGTIERDEHSETSDNDGEVKVYFSTDREVTTVNFSHQVIYKNNDNISLNEGDKLVHTRFEDDTAYTEVETNWKTTGSYTKNSSSPIMANPFASNDIVAEPNDAKGTSTVTLQPGETAEVCSRITYDKKSYNFTSIDHTVVNENNITKHKDYLADYYSEGSSIACAVITRAKDPEGTDPNDPNPIVIGDTNSNITFVGESSNISWNITAKGVSTRRLAARQITQYLVNPELSEPYYRGTSSRSNTTSPFDYFSNNILERADINTTTWNTSDNSKYATDFINRHPTDNGDNFNATYKVPNFVGAKICATAGYQFEYWWGVSKGGDITWNKGYQNPYWYIFDAACRTIAKRPLVAAWNGGIMASGEIITALPDRFNDIKLGERTDGAAHTLYGSWAEYLVASNTDPKHSSRTMGSGASLSNGSVNTKLCSSKPWESNSPLTIANVNAGNTDVCSLQPSGIISNTTSFITRLSAYLNNIQENPNITKTNNINDLYNEINSSIVFTSDGDLTITQDIKISDSTNYVLDKLPQAVIFVKNGNININENVQRIDAWIVVTGSKSNNTGMINTCVFNNETFTPGSERDSYNVTSEGRDFPGNHCTQQLIFNGPVIARTLNLQRTYGSEALPTRSTGVFGDPNSKQSPAEIFNLRADSYLWGYAQSSRYGSNFSEVYSRELAPRH